MKKTNLSKQTLIFILIFFINRISYGHIKTKISCDSILDNIYVNLFSINPKGKCQIIYNNEIISGENHKKIYNGFIKNGRGNGKGRLIYFINNKIYEIQRGFFKNDKLNGKGKILRIDEDFAYIERGNFKNGRLYKKGEITKLTLKKSNDEKHYKIYREKKFFDGNIYIKLITKKGNFYLGGMNGKGKVINNEEGIICEGDYLWDKLDGQGECIKKDEYIYRGSYHLGLKHGFGEEIYLNGTISRGFFNDDHFERK